MGKRDARHGRSSWPDSTIEKEILSSSSFFLFSFLFFRYSMNRFVWTRSKGTLSFSDRENNDAATLAIEFHESNGGKCDALFSVHGQL